MRIFILFLFATSCHAFNFGDALDTLLAGGKVARAGWVDQFVYRLPGTSLSVSRPPLLGPFEVGQHIHQLPRFEVCTAVARLLTCGPYVPTADDVLANDWVDVVW